MAPSADISQKEDNGLSAPKPAPGLFTIESIPDKGKGVIAAQDITPGTLLISEPPLLTTAVITSIPTTEADLARALKASSKGIQRAFLSLHNNYVGQGTPLTNIIRSNGYPLGASSDVGGVFELTSRINHSCQPNAYHGWNPLLEEHTVYAIRQISAGEEITLAYHYGGPSEYRKEILKERFGFDCTCSICTLPPSEQKASDDRHVLAQTLDAQIGDAKTVRFNPTKVLQHCKALMRIYEEEDFKDDRLARLCYDVFQVCNMHSDRARAAYWAKKYCDAKKRTGGKDSVAFLEMKPFVKKPERHDCFGVTSDWKSDLKEIPKERSGEVWEKWLWRE
ncbi:hypothetical protein HYALB_00000429 [Hymenoscyphus albidus]|uniref:SET domain-containing protein n=1 Tax=Hymenoscyphus albidus TaxID=595503 RepID=A0A9N9LKM5_9HELO|nr:hypothetical protein HYALB_00000429 [Hymenoscyphus albidus]